MEIYLKKTVKENFPNLAKVIDMQVKEGQRIPIMMDAKKPTPRHIIIKMPNVKDKERLLKARENYWKGARCRGMGEVLRGLKSTNR